MKIDTAINIIRRQQEANKDDKELYNAYRQALISMRRDIQKEPKKGKLFGSHILPPTCSSCNTPVNTYDFYCRRCGQGILWR